MCLGNLCFVKKHQAAGAPGCSHHLLLRVARNTANIASVAVPQHNPLITKSCAAISNIGTRHLCNSSPLKFKRLLAFVLNLLLLKSFFHLKEEDLEAQLLFFQEMAVPLQKIAEWLSS